MGQPASGLTPAERESKLEQKKILRAANLCALQHNAFVAARSLRIESSQRTFFLEEASARRVEI